MTSSSSRPRPTVLVASADPALREDLADALRVRYDSRYRVRTVASLGEAVQLVADGTGQAQGGGLALAVTTEHLTDADGVEALEAVSALCPSAGGLLLLSGEQHRVGLPVRALALPDGPEQWEAEVLPVVDELLLDWKLSRRKGATSAVSVVGSLYSAPAYRIRDFLTRNAVPFTFVDTEPDAARGTGDDAAADGGSVTVVLADGRRLTDPGLSLLALELGLSRPASRTHYDLIVVGGGPAGLAGAVYGACENLDVLLVEDDAPGGQAGSTSRIENYLGFPAGLTGSELAQRALTQARRMGVEWVSTRVATALVPGPDGHTVHFDDGSRISARAVLVATGMQWRTLPVPGVERLTGAGVYFGSCLSEARASRGRHVYMIGAGNSAGQAALHFAEHADSVTLLVRDTSRRPKAMSAYLLDRIEENGRVELRTQTEVVETLGTTRLTGLRLRDTVTGAVEEVPASLLHVLIGSVPAGAWLADVCARDDAGFLLTGTDVRQAVHESADRLPRPWPEERDPFLMETSVPGVFAAGDVRAGSVKRVGSAVGEGAVALQAALTYLRTRPQRSAAVPAPVPPAAVAPGAAG
ncbi:FAD-dependent oxidoreductase [Kitasatospora sp. CMC57]|uniref:FAD-dependent oxidoreductase n=1 Tax=Kitasatospora sp. CMC57 TaxID=3231513 RepID=A0AB33JZW5_9ACTN